MAGSGSLWWIGTTLAEAAWARPLESTNGARSANEQRPIRRRFMERRLSYRGSPGARRAPRGSSPPRHPAVAGTTASIATSDHSFFRAVFATKGDVRLLVRRFEQPLELGEVLLVCTPHGACHERCGELREARWGAAVSQGHPR